MSRDDTDMVIYYIIVIIIIYLVLCAIEENNLIGHVTSPQNPSVFLMEPIEVA